MSIQGLSFAHDSRRCFKSALLATSLLVMTGCASLTLHPQPNQVVAAPVTVELDSASPIVANSATATLDGQSVTLTCATVYVCTSQPMPIIVAGPHTVTGSISTNCGTCVPNPFTLNGTSNFIVPTIFTLSQTQLTVQQGSSGDVGLAFKPIVNAVSALSASGVMGVSLGLNQVPIGTDSMVVAVDVASTAPLGTHTLTIDVDPPSSSQVPVASATLQLTVTAGTPPPSMVQTGPFAQATITTVQTSINGQYVVKFAPAPPVGSNAPMAPNTAQFFTIQGNTQEGGPIGFYPDGGAAFCAAGKGGVVMTPVPANSGLGTNANALYFFQVLPTNGALPKIDAYSVSQDGSFSYTPAVYFSPDCSLAMVTGVNYPNDQAETVIYRLNPFTFIASVPFSISISASVISGGLNGEVQVKADNGAPVPYPIP